MAPDFSYILVAEDDTDDQLLFINQFAQASPGSSVKFFRDGQDILNFLDKCPSYQLPKVLLLDYAMPMVNGVQVLRKLAGQSRYNTIRKFVWSTSDINKYVEESLACGAERYFRKPANQSELEEIINQISAAYHGTPV
jgi:CheY-like chemotaxis protein